MCDMKRDEFDFLKSHQGMHVRWFTGAASEALLLNEKHSTRHESCSNLWLKGSFGRI